MKNLTDLCQAAKAAKTANPTTKPAAKLAKWDQADYEARRDELESQIALLEVALKARGVTAEQRPAVPHDDLIVAVETLEAHAAKLGALARLTPAPKAVAAKAPTMTLTARAIAAREAKQTTIK